MASAYSTACDDSYKPFEQQEKELAQLRKRHRSLEAALLRAEERATALAAENKELRRNDDPACEHRDSTGELDARLAMVSSALWDGARRLAEVVAERHELAERCARAEASAQTARDSCERLATKLASILGPEQTLRLQPATKGMLTPTHCYTNKAERDALLSLGRQRFEERREARRQSQTASEPLLSVPR